MQETSKALLISQDFFKDKELVNRKTKHKICQSDTVWQPFLEREWWPR